MQEGDRFIEILKPEYLLAMKVIRFSKNPDNARGVSDRLDIVKLLETMENRNIAIDHEQVRAFLNRHENIQYDRILNQVETET